MSSGRWKLGRSLLDGHATRAWSLGVLPCTFFRAGALVIVTLECQRSLSHPCSFLDIVERGLAAAGFTTCRLDGKTPAKRRGEVLRAFASGAPPCCVAWLSATCTVNCGLL